MKRHICGFNIGLLFAAVICLGLLSGIVRAVFFPKDVCNYEGRQANRLAALTPESYADASFQDSMEEALADQIPGSQYFKKMYNVLKYGYQRVCLLPLAEKHPDMFFDYGEVSFLGDYLVYRMTRVTDSNIIVNSLADCRRAQIEANPDTEFYFFYIETDRDIDLTTLEKSGRFEYCRDRMGLPEDRAGKLSLDDRETYEKYFFKTDCHWNCYGAYEGYRQLMRLLGCNEPLLEPVEAEYQPLFWSGIKAVSAGFSDYREPFPLYRFDFPEMRMYELGQQVPDLDRQEAFFGGELDSISYIGYYGKLIGEVSVSTDRPDRENLLLLGDSFDNAIVKLAASHFNNTYSVDLRIYKEDTGKAFDMGEYIKEHDIDKVVYCCSYLSVADDLNYQAEVENGI